MLKRGALVGIGIAMAITIAWRRENARETEPASERESTSARLDPIDRAPSTVPTADVAAPPSVTPVDDPVHVASEQTLAQMAEIRREVHLLEMQRLDARNRGDTEAETRLDREIAAQRAEHERLHDTLTAPEGI